MDVAEARLRLRVKDNLDKLRAGVSIQGSFGTPTKEAHVTKLNQTQQAIMDALANPDAHRADWAKDPDDPELMVPELEGALGKARSTVVKAIRELERLALVKASRQLGRRGRARLMTVKERDMQQASERRVKATSALRRTINAELGFGQYSGGPVGLHRDRDQDDSYDVRLDLGAMSEAKLRQVLAAINSVDPALLAPCQDED